MFSLSAGDHGFCILLPTPGGNVPPRRQEFEFGGPKAKGFLAKISNLLLPGWNKICLSPLTVLVPGYFD